MNLKKKLEERHDVLSVSFVSLLRIDSTLLHAKAELAKCEYKCISVGASLYGGTESVTKMGDQIFITT